MVVKRKSKTREEREFVSVRIRNYTIKESYKLFCEQHPDLCSRSTFFKYKPKYVKISKRFTDFCPICKSSKKIFSKVEKNPSLASGLLKDTYEDAKFHADLVKKRNNDFVKCLENIKEHSCLLVMVISICNLHNIT